MTYDMGVNVHDRATAFVAQTQIFQNGDDFIEIRPVPVGDFSSCAQERFVPPSGDWERTLDLLKQERLLVLVGERGSGRRTAALRRLRQACGIDPIHELEPVWSRPRAKLLPPVRPGYGYLLDLSDPTEQRPVDQFGGQLLQWAKDQQIFLVVITTQEVWNGRWTHGANDVAVRIGSPDALRLTERELSINGHPDLVPLLQDPAFAPIWKSNPRAEDARRLARIITAASAADPGRIVAEYEDWRNWINDQLPATLGPRALLWASAFCDGGQRKSVMRMSEDLRRKLGERRTPADILGDSPASKRLKEAKIETEGDRVRLAPEQHGLAAAVRRHLWDEYEDQTNILKDWVVNQAATLEYEDAARVLDAVLDLVIQYRDDELLRSIRTTLTGERRPLAVRALSRAALDPQFGAHVRGRLYTWLASPSQETIDLVAEVCGDRFGIEKPDMALVRLRRAAQKSRPGSSALANAFTNLASHHPLQVLEAIRLWSTGTTWARAGNNAFLALASQDQGAEILYGRTGEHVGNPKFRKDLTRYFDTALGDPTTSQTAIEIMNVWAALVEQGRLDEEATVDVFAGAYAPRVQDPVIQRFLLASAHPGLDTFWGRVLTRALKLTPEAETDARTG
ncbi:hypothetical protein [Actinomadura kijaniata]|uniref:hypothetical protein n=1 Tax=Actinomadura kijaniata TaxID=46161 RepID=UPI00082CD427|nr:hypothetical protein [Actinomadura kijaniata]